MLRATISKAFVALLALAGSAASSSGSDSPVTQAWIADPEEQYLLDVQLRRNRIGDSVRAYPTPEGSCVIFGDFLTTLDVPMKIDLETQRASGWAFSEENRIEIDRSTRTATVNGKREPIATSDIREAAEGWCIDTGALSTWFGLSIEPNLLGAVLTLESEAKLPVELAAERRRRAERMRDKVEFDYASLPQVKLPYRMWRTPALDVVVNAGTTYNAHGGVDFDASGSLYASGELAGMSFDARIGASDRRRTDLRFRAYRSDVTGDMLGPLKATHFEFGDLQHGANGVGTQFGGGRGALVTNRPLRRMADFDRVTFEGELPPGWDAELYRNGQLLAFATRTDDDRYLFEDIELTYGDNEVEIVLYGPQGQVRRRTEQVMVGSQQVPPGESWYFASVSQPGRDLLDFDKGPDEPNRPVDAQATLAFDHGLNRETSVGLLAQALLTGDERVTWVEGSVRRTFGPVYVEGSADYNSRGGHGLRARALTELGGISIAASSEVRRGLTLTADDVRVRSSHNLALSAPIKLGRTRIPLSTRFNLKTLDDGTRTFINTTRASASVGRVNLGAEVDWQRTGIGDPDRDPFDRVTGRLVGSGRVGPVRLQSLTEFDLDDLSLERTTLSGYWAKSERSAWEGGLAFEPRLDRARARVSHVRQFQAASVALTAEAATDGSFAAGINVAFSLDAPSGSFRPTSQPLARTGAIRARLFRDDNANGIRDADEPYQKGVALTAGYRTSEQVSDEKGEVLLAGLPVHNPIAIGIDHDTLADPTLTPKDALRVMVPRAGVTGTVDIPLVGAGMVEGMIANASGTVEGIELVLKDRAGTTVARTRTDFDGYFLFEQVAYGDYRIALSEMTANVLMVEASLDRPVAVTPDRPFVRLGTIGLKHDSTRIAEARAPPVAMADLELEEFAAPVVEAELSASEALDTAALVDALVGGGY